jgi:alpha-galactosidase
MYCRKTFEEMLDANSPVKPFSFHYDGKPCDLKEIPCTVETGEDGTRKMIYEPVPGIIRLTLEMTVWPDYPVIEYTPYLENISQKDSGIISEFSALDHEAEDPVAFGLQKLNDAVFYGNSRISVRYHLGSKANGADFLPQRRDLFARPGSNKLELQCEGAWCSTDYLPFFAVDNDPMNGIDLAIGWNGGWKFSVEKEVTNGQMGHGKKSRIRCGMKRAEFLLHPGEKVMQPGILLHFREGKSIRDGQNEFRRFMIAHHAPRNSRGELIKPPICFEVWGGLETDKQLQRIQVIHEKQLPYEEWWIDAGWMGSPGPCPHFLEKSEHSSDWYTRVGSWDFNTWAHPHGLKPVADAVHRAGMRLMVWFEALRVSSASRGAILKEHPEWLLGDHASAAEGKTVSYLLNIGIPEARQYLIDTICGIMEREGIDDYREDFNMDAWFCLSQGDEPGRIGITEMKYVEGFYLFWEELRKRFPDMYIDNCSGGGRRLDYKTASMAFPLCQSDFACYLPYEEECVQLENLYLDDWLPLHGTLNWGPDDPYHLVSGLGGGLGCKIWQFNGREPKPDHDYDLHRRLLEWGKQLRDIHLTGDVYPQTEAPENDWTKWNGQQIHDPRKNCGMVQIFRRKNSPDPDFRLKLSGLFPDAVYETEFFSGEKKQLSGRELASLTIHLDSPRSFQILRYKMIRSA